MAAPPNVVIVVGDTGFHGPIFNVSNAELASRGLTHEEQAEVLQRVNALVAAPAAARARRSRGGGGGAGDWVARFGYLSCGALLIAAAPVFWWLGAMGIMGNGGPQTIYMTMSAIAGIAAFLGVTACVRAICVPSSRGDDGTQELLRRAGAGEDALGVVGEGMRELDASLLRARGIRVHLRYVPAAGAVGDDVVRLWYGASGRLPPDPAAAADAAAGAAGGGPPTTHRLALYFLLPPIAGREGECATQIGPAGDVFGQDADGALDAQAVRLPVAPSAPEVEQQGAGGPPS